MTRSSMTLSASLISACGHAVGGGAVGGFASATVGGPVGGPCDPAFFKQGCHSNNKMECDAATSKWKLLGACDGQTCKETADPAAPGKSFKVVACETSTSPVADAGATDGSSTGGDATTAIPDGAEVQSDGTVLLPDGQVVGLDAFVPPDVQPDVSGELPPLTDVIVTDTKPADTKPADTIETPDVTKPDAVGDIGGPLFECVFSKCSEQWSKCLQTPGCLDKVYCAQECGSNVDCILQCGGSGSGANEFMMVVQCAAAAGCNKPTATCGNGLCEPPEESVTSCPKDCASKPEPGCKSAADQAYLSLLYSSSSETQKFSDASKTCTLGGCFPKPSDDEGAICIGKCIVGKGIKMSESCATCFGAYSYCLAKNCLGACAAAPTGLECTKCAEQKGCTQAKDACVGPIPTLNPVCGNGKCESGENATSCPKDCGLPAACGNGICEPGENATNCKADCAPSTCGNGKCDAGEDPVSCPADCKPPAGCGDGQCSSGEKASTCPIDCDPQGKCLFTKCQSQTLACFTSTPCGQMYQCVGQCQGNQTCAQNCAAKDPKVTAQKLQAMLMCWNDSGCENEPTCGDDQCETGESATTCPEDCGATPAKCGNGKCEAGETATNCKVDCGGFHPCDSACDYKEPPKGFICYCNTGCKNGTGNCCADLKGTFGKLCTGSTCAACNK